MKLPTMAAALFLGLAARAQAQSAAVTITVQPGVIHSLTVQLNTGATSYALGTITLDSLSSGATAYIVTNDGNISESFALQITTETDPVPGPGIAVPGYPWASTDTSTATPNGLTDRYQLFAQFTSSAALAPGASPGFVQSDPFLVMKATARMATGVQFAGNQNGLNVSAVPGTNAKCLYFAIKTGSYSTTATEKHISVTVSGL